MANNYVLLSRSSKIAAAAVIAAATILPVLAFRHANAGQVTDRTIKMTNSATGATSVTYDIQFEAATSTLTKSFVVDFCAGNSSPLIGLACIAPGGFTIGAPTVTVPATLQDGVTANTISGAWTATALNAGRTLTLVDSTGVTPNVGDGIRFTITTVTNPNDVHTVTGGLQVGTFFARILTYADDDDDTNGCTVADDNAGCYAAAAENVYIDAGGIAMSTTNNLTVTARVQEQLTFCVYVGASSTTCALATGSSANIPDATTPLSNTAVSINSGSQSTWFNVASNALSGVDVRMWSNNGNQGLLKSGAFYLDAFGGYDSGDSSVGNDTSCVADSTTSSVEQFGMRIEEGAGVTPAGNYNCASGNHGWDVKLSTGTDTTGVGSTYGDIIASTAAPNDETGSESQLEFAAKAALTSEAGVYQSILNFIATGKY